MSQEICIVPYVERDSLFPSQLYTSMELCKHLTSRNFKLVIFIPSNLSSSIPYSLSQNPLVRVAEIPSPGPPHDDQNQMVLELEKILQSKPISHSSRPVCAIIDVMMHCTAEMFHKFNVPTIAFFASSACSAAMEVATWTAHPMDLKPGEVRFLPRQPEEIPLTYKQRPSLPRHHEAGHPGLGPDSPKEGDKPLWTELVDGSIAVMINTSEELERPSLDYIAKQIGKPVMAVGPLSTEQYLNGWSTATMDEAKKWLDSQLPASVLYVSSGSEVGLGSYAQLADALEVSHRAFIWEIQPGGGRRGSSGSGPTNEGYFPHGLDSKMGSRGLIIREWAPQLSILSHPSIGGFLSHCGWNSTVEAIGRGVPFLTWPIRGDQYHNAKLVVAHLKVGYMISDDLSEKITKEDIIEGIDKLLGDEEMKRRAIALADTFQHGLSASSEANLEAFKSSIHKKVV